MPRSRYKKSDEIFITLLFSSKCITFIFFILSQSIISGDCPCIFYSLSSETIVLRYLPYFCATKTQWRSMNSTLPLLIAGEIGGVPVGRGGWISPKIYSAAFLPFAEEFVTWLPTRDSLLKYRSIPTNFLRNLYPRTYVGYIHDMAIRLFCFNRGYIQHFFYMIDPGIFSGKSLVRFPGIDNF